MHITQITSLIFDFDTNEYEVKFQNGDSRYERKYERYSELPQRVKNLLRYKQPKRIGCKLIYKGDAEE